VVFTPSSQMLQDGKRHDLTGGGLLNDVKSLICNIAVRLLNFSGSSVSCRLKINKSAVSRRISGFQKNDNFQIFLLYRKNIECP
jgi:hypothetical protein